MRSFSLELQPQRELKDAGISRTGYLAVVRAAQGRSWVAGISVVERVERLRAELQMGLLRDAEGLVQGRIEQLLARPADDTSLCGAIESPARRREGTAVDAIGKPWAGEG